MNYINKLLSKTLERSSTVGTFTVSVNFKPIFATWPNMEGGASERDTYSTVLARYVGKADLQGGSTNTTASDENTLFDTLRNKNLNHCPWHNVVYSRRRMLGRSSSSWRNLWSTILHFHFSFQMHLWCFTIIWISMKVHWTSTINPWLPRSRVCGLGFLWGTERPFSLPVVV